MIPVLVSLLLLTVLPACGVLVPYFNDAQILQDRLIVSMPRDQVLRRLGRPDRIVRDGGRQTIWEYRLYPKGEWTAYLIHCPFFPNCYFPAERGHPYHVVLQDDQLCLWGTPNVVEPLLGVLCDSEQSDRRVQTATSQTSVVPVFMPPPIVPLPERLAIVPGDPYVDSGVKAWLDLTLNFLRTRHPQLVLVEREDLRAILDEMGFQYTGHLDEETTIRLGRLTGADSLLIYRCIVQENSRRSAAFELRVLNVENGTTVFRQTTSASHTPLLATTQPVELYANTDVGHQHLVLEQAAAYGLAAFTAAFGDNPLGLVYDYRWTGQGIKVIDVLQGGPGFRAGLKRGDEILESNKETLRNWTDFLSVPASLTVKREALPVEITVR
ncbi:MAG TPA: PDZ domain-containing protein [Nitrospira sp.]|nr:PDZ domain-containing protein [Nitrospira sp.]